MKLRRTLLALSTILLSAPAAFAGVMDNPNTPGTWILIDLIWIFMPYLP